MVAARIRSSLSKSLRRTFVVLAISHAALVSAQDTQAPTAPSNLVATPLSTTQVNVTWSPSGDNVGVTGYRIERCTGASCTNFVEIGTSSSGARTGPLRISTQNPRYFMDASGRAILLGGSHTWFSLVDAGLTDPPPVFDYTRYLDFLSARHHNFFRLWADSLPKRYWIVAGSEPGPWYTAQHPWLRTGPGTAIDGKPKFDLSRFDESYFTRMRTRVQQANARGIFVSVMLFDGFHVQIDRRGDDGYPLSGSNNINGVNDGGGTRSQDLSQMSPAVLAAQEAYVRKVIDTVNDLPNVLYEIANEAGSYSTTFQQHFIAFIKNYEASKPLQHPVGFTYQYAGGTDSTLYNSAADWVAPSERYPSNNGTRHVIINDTDHSAFWVPLQDEGPGSQRDFVWKNFTAGNSAMFMDPFLHPWSQRNNPTGCTGATCTTVDPQWDPIRNNIGYMLDYANTKLDLARMLPRGTLSSTGNCLANAVATGAEYLVYNETGGSFTVNLSATTRQLAVEWLNPVSGAITSGGTVNGGSSSQSFTAPFSGKAVLYLVDRAGRATATSYTDTTASAGTTYRYRVRAADAAGNLSGYSALASATTPGGGGDTTAPTVSITTPTTGSSYSTSASSVNVGGTSSDNVAVTQVSWSNDRGGSGAATGTTAWSVSSIALQSGANAITITARDSAGNSSIDTLTVTYTPTSGGGGSGPVAAYNFNEGTGSSLTDASGNGNLGTISGATWTSSGKNGGALQFDGTNDRVFVAASASLNATSAVTLEAWVYPTANQSGWRAIVQREVDAYLLHASNSAGPLYPAVGGTFNGTHPPSMSAPSAIAVNTWTHLAMTYDGSTQRLYVNGAQVASGARSGNLETNSNPLWIGGNSPYGEYFQGRIDDVRVYNRALTTTELQADMNTAVDASPPSGSDTQAPTAPAGLTATAVSSSQINLSWTAATDNVGVTGYRLERCQAASCANFAQIATPTTTTYSNTSLAPSTSYTYRVRAVDAAGNLGPYSNAASATTQAPPADTTAPSAPSGATAASASSSQINVSWTASTDNVGVTGYRVERCTGVSCTNFAQIGTPTGTSFGDSALAASTAYRYRVRAADAAGNLSGYSNIATATTGAATDTQAPTTPGTASASALSSTQISVSWGASTDNVAVTSYPVERCLGSTCTNFAQIGTPTGTTYSDSSLAPASTYRYRVRARDAAGNLSSYSSIASATTQSAAPNAGPIASYNFNEGAGSTLTDVSGNANTGAITGATWTAAGRTGGALEFDGVNDRVFVNSSTTLNMTSSVTLEAWVYPTASQSGWRTILQRQTDAYLLHASNSAGPLRPAAGGTFNGVHYPSMSAPSAIPVNAWTHLAMTYDGTVLRIYVNGAQVATDSRNRGPIETNNNPLWIGGNDPYGEYFKGRIDDVRVYARALGAAEIQTDMNRPVTAP